MASINAHLRAGFMLTLLALTLAIFTVPVHLPKLIGRILPFAAARRFSTRLNEAVLDAFSATVKLGVGLLLDIRWDIRGVDGLRRDRWYFVNANHQSWTDLPVLLIALHRRISPLKIFLKKELLWVPVIGTACWAMDFPIMRRHSRNEIEKHPEKVREDFETTRKACARYGDRPVSILNFVEGTRFTPDKHRRQKSPYRHLLRPKAGGMAFALYSMGGRVREVIDVTIVYPPGRSRLWDFMGGRMSTITVRVQTAPIPTDLLAGSYLDDPDFKQRFQRWLNRQWEEKDDRIQRLRNQ